MTGRTRSFHAESRASSREARNDRRAPESHRAQRERAWAVPGQETGMVQNKRLLGVSCQFSESAPRARGDGPVTKTGGRGRADCSPRTRGWSPVPRPVRVQDVLTPRARGDGERTGSASWLSAWPDMDSKEVSAKSPEWMRLNLAMSYEEYAQRLSAGLSAAARSVWAKHDWDSGGWLPLWRHMGDSAGVAAYLWDEWLAPQVRVRISEALPEGEADGRRLAVWLAMVHDIGKATPAFACQVDELAEGMRSNGLVMDSAKQMTERSKAPHGVAGQLLLAGWLQGRGWSRRE